MVSHSVTPSIFTSVCREAAILCFVFSKHVSNALKTSLLATHDLALFLISVLADSGLQGFSRSNFLGQVTGPCSVNYALSAMILTAGEIANPGYTAQTWHVYLVFLLLLIVEGLLTMNSTKFLGRLNELGTILNLIVLVIFVAWFPAGSINHPKTNDSHYVWTDIVNGTEWPAGLGFIMGFLSVIWTMSGYDAPFHLSEECSNANIASPRAIVMTAQLGLYLGFAIILVIAYTVKDITAVVAGPYGQPMGSLCLQVLGQKAGLAMFSLNIIAQFFVGQGCTVASSRVVYAYSRDGALPGSRWWKKVNKHTNTPVNAVWFVLAVGALLGLLMFASPVAIGAVFSIGAIAQYMAFIFPVALKLFVVGDQFKPGKHILAINLSYKANNPQAHGTLAAGLNRSAQLPSRTWRSLSQSSASLHLRAAI